MTIDKLLYPTQAFLHDKILPTLEYALSRIELSNYFHSFKDYRSNISALDVCHRQIDTVLDALNQLKDKIYYRVPLQLMLNSYFTFCKPQLVAFDANVQVVCYSYNRRSYTYVGIINNLTRHSPLALMFLKKYTTVDGNAFVFR